MLGRDGKLLFVCVLAAMTMRIKAVRKEINVASVNSLNAFYIS